MMNSFRKQSNQASMSSQFNQSLNLNSSSKKMININSFIDELKCSICLELFQNPRTLNCQHSFCSKCLEPLAKDKIFSCPQCRSSCFYESIDRIAKNSLLTSLVENIKLTKAACPECKDLCELIICEHCSQIFCDSCHQKHMEKTMEKLDNRLVTVETLPKILETLKANIGKSEQETMAKVVQQMDRLQIQILQLWQARKFTLIDEIKKFYKKKTEEIDIAEFRLKVLTRTILEMNQRKNKLESNYQSLTTTNCNQITKFYNELAQFETDLVNLENKFKDAFANFDINTNELKLQFNELNNTQLFKNVLDNVKLITCSAKDDSLLDNAVKPTKNTSCEEVLVKDYFGNKTCVLLDTNSNETVEHLKQKVKFLLGVEPKYINFFNKKTNKKLDDKLELVVKAGKVYAKHSDGDEVTDRDEIELFINYKY